MADKVPRSKVLPFPVLPFPSFLSLSPSLPPFLSIAVLRYISPHLFVPWVLRLRFHSYRFDEFNPSQPEAWHRKRNCIHTSKTGLYPGVQSELINRIFGLRTCDRFATPALTMHRGINFPKDSSIIRVKKATPRSESAPPQERH